MDSFLRIHPRVALEVNLNDRVGDLIEEGYDLAVRRGSVDVLVLNGARPILRRQA